MPDNGIFGERTSYEALDASFFNAAAERAICSYCGWHVAPPMEVSGTVGTAGGRFLRIPGMNVTSLTRLEFADGTDLLDGAQWSADGVVELARPLSASVAGVSYTAVTGFDPEAVPDLVAVALQVARRAASAPAGTVRSQSVNGASVSYAFSGDGASSVQLLAPERAVLDRYRVVGLP